MRCIDLSKYFAAHAPHVDFVVRGSGDDVLGNFNATISVKSAKANYSSNYGHIIVDAVDMTQNGAEFPPTYSFTLPIIPEKD